RRGVEIVLPVDLVGATGFAADAEHDVYPADAFPADRETLAIGPASRDLFARKLAGAKPVFSNGHVGVFAFPSFAAGTKAVAEGSSRVQGWAVGGGGAAATAVGRRVSRDPALSPVPKGGGASWAYPEGKPFRGLAALEDGR